jgi:hypothetical protein
MTGMKCVPKSIYQDKWRTIACLQRDIETKGYNSHIYFGIDYQDACRIPDEFKVINMHEEHSQIRRLRGPKKEMFFVC